MNSFTHPRKKTSKEKSERIIDTDECYASQSAYPKRQVAEDELQKFEPNKRQKVEPMFDECVNLLTGLINHKYGYVFSKPVDPERLHVPDYFDVIKNPMDLGTVKDKLIRNLYTSSREFAADIRLTFANAKKYNPPDNVVHHMAIDLSTIFEQRWKYISKLVEEEANHFVQRKCCSDSLGKLDAPLCPLKCSSGSASLSSKRSQSQAVLLQKRNRKLNYLSRVRGMDRGMWPLKKDTLRDSPKNSYRQRETSLHIVESSKQKRVNAARKTHKQIRHSMKKLPTCQNQEVESSIKQRMTMAEKVKILEILNRLNGHALPQVVELFEAHAPDDELGCNVKKGLLLSKAERMSDDLARELRELLDRIAKQKDMTLTQEQKATRHQEMYISQSEKSTRLQDVHLGRGKQITRQQDVRLSEKTTKKQVVTFSEKQKCNHQRQQDKKQKCNRQRQQESPHYKLEKENKQTNDAAYSREDDYEGRNAFLECSSPERKLHAALMISRFKDTILKAHEKSLSLTKQMNPTNKITERERVESLQQREKARIEAAQKWAEAQAKAKADLQREKEREAARSALQDMEKNAEMNENYELLKDLERLSCSMPLSSEESNEELEFFAQNPLERLGLYIKNEEDIDYYEN